MPWPFRPTESLLPRPSLLSKVLLIRSNPRALSNRGTAYVGAIRVPIVGRISMDLTTFDVTEVPADGLRPGDSIDLIGPHYTVDDLARDADTIGYEIVTGFGPRLRRVYIGKHV